MKNIIRKLIFFIVIFFICNCLSAQIAHMSVVSMPGFPDSAVFNQTYTFQAILYCDTASSSPYSGPVHILFYTDNTNVLFPDTFGTAANQVTINPGEHDTVTITGVEFGDTSAFKLGGNVVVVWPVSGGGTQIETIDTFYTNVEILGYAGITDITENDIDYYIYPVPANDKLFLPENISGNNIEYVRIFDVFGRTKVLLRKYPKYVPVSQFDSGFYFLEIKGKNNEVRIFKFIVSK